MENGIFRALINNGAVLLALSAVFETAYFLPARYQRFKTVFSGILIAGACIAVMAAPFRIQSGIIFDTRSILISVTALIFGPVPASITAAAALAFRLFIGGIGTW
ncbi:MAG: diguanylate cyclase, partial [Clostridiales bacterium]|nr:diguanylate cyclase [Clostridiales bacterium]